MTTRRICDACSRVENPDESLWLGIEGRPGAFGSLGDGYTTTLDLCPRCNVVLCHLIKTAQDNGLDLKGAVVEESVAAS